MIFQLISFVPRLPRETCSARILVFVRVQKRTVGAQGENECVANKSRLITRARARARRPTNSR